MTEASRAELRDELLSRIPRWYTPWLHLAFPAIVGLAIAVFALSRIGDLRAWQLALVPLFLVFGNAVEWHAHRGLLHRRTRFIEVLYVRHTPQHHAVYVADDMAIRSARELKLILLPAYGVLAILALTSPITIALVRLGQPNLGALWVASVVGYVLGYEWLHLAYHLPEHSVIGRLRLVRKLRRHHQLHHAPHLMQRWNFNVTVPLWDVVRGTVYRPHPVAPIPRAVRRSP
ncbi:sterol desaturase family protein [Anaeromyxobacter oryzae]|uniref:Fatty acid hydroxylase n=1 Tax=Anaeromyxobacter oryzae TaxID=2918170 RepID=A0ABM7X2F8_9BACT|nr:sterol desaturase family protein [Anaeromyxobacter oryzae]BDG05974.1 fatty acid hydroxylase [Anaeromyxobacter oryzae]